MFFISYIITRPKHFDCNDIATLPLLKFPCNSTVIVIIIFYSMPNVYFPCFNQQQSYIYFLFIYLVLWKQLLRYPFLERKNPTLFPKAWLCGELEIFPFRTRAMFSVLRRRSSLIEDRSSWLIDLHGGWSYRGYRSR